MINFLKRLLNLDKKIAKRELDFVAKEKINDLKQKEKNLMFISKKRIFSFHQEDR